MSKKREKCEPPPRKISNEPLSHSPRTEAIAGYREPVGKRVATDSPGPIFSEEAVDHDGVELRVPAPDGELIRQGASTLDQLAFHCGEEVPKPVLANIGLARSVLLANDIDPHQISYELDKSYPLRCHEAGALLGLVHGLGGLGMNLTPILSAPLQEVFWACLQMAYGAGRLGAKIETRPKERYTSTGIKVHASGEELKAERKALDAEMPSPPPGKALSAHCADKNGTRDRVTEDRIRRKGNTITPRKCDCCHNPFLPKTNRAKYCHECVNLSRHRKEARRRKCSK